MPLPAVLTTKFFFPPAFHNLVSRPRLLEKVTRGLQCPLLLISAPAGYGKTTLLAEWRSGPGSGMPVAWLTLDNEDNDLSRFLIYLSTALDTLKAGIGDSVISMLQSPQPTPPQIVLTVLINDLTDSLRTPFSLVLDDYHVLTSEQVHAALIFLLDHMPPQMHLVILTRADPPLPLPSLRARNQLAELRAADLRFTLEEAATFLNNMMGLNLPNENIAALEERAEGWIASLQLAALSMQGREDLQDFVSAFTGSHHYVIDYLVEEVLNRQPEAMREFLLKTSILDRLTAPLCNALTDQTNGQVILDYLEHANLFVVPLDDEQRWYRYHHLFADATRNRLQQMHTDWIPSLHRHAAEWYEQNGFVSEAIRHLLAVKDMGQAAQLIESNAISLLTRGELVTLLDWIGWIDPLVSERPWLCVYRSWGLTLTGKLDSVEQWLQEAERHLPASSSDEQLEDMIGHIAAIRSYMAVLKGDALQATCLARQALQHLPESDQIVRSAVTGTLGRACWISGDLEGASRAFEEAARFGLKAGNLHLASGATCSQADLLCELGRLQTAAETYQEALHLATLPDGRRLPVAGRACTGLSKVYYEWNDLEAVTKFTNESIKLCQQFGSADILSISNVMLARLKQALGDLDSARQAMKQAARLARDHHLWPAWASWVEAFQMRLWLTSVNDSIGPEQTLELASRWTQKIELDINKKITYPREIEYLMFARLLLAKGERNQALTLLTRLIHQTESTGRTGIMIELLLVQALAYQATKDNQRALIALEQALSLAQPEGYVRVFLDEGEPIVDLLRQARSHRIAPQYVARLLSEYDKLHIPGAGLAPNQDLIVPLSERELEILRLVADGKSNQQIAERLYIARGTVKKHINNIFGKLGVQSRTQCVARGRELNLL